MDFVAKERDLTAVTRFLEQHDMGVDDLFYVLHLGARQLATKQEIPAPVREHWHQVAEQCHDLWHNTLRTGQRLV
ncbi:MAG: hypothetical protein K0R39_1789 [Symbiobacteriaceae bacterium]|jgi:hypothetical protein|nr:hypothetical protein [Symbiobacteriaceae bacterium]